MIEKTKTIYECSYCGLENESKDIMKDHEEICKIRDEEKKNTPIIPNGMIFGEPTNPNAFYTGMTFSTAQIISQDGRYLNALLWACRNNVHGDSLDYNVCGGSMAFPKKGGDSPNIYHPTFKRMLVYLKEKIGIKNVTVWNGSKPIPVEDYLDIYETNLEKYLGD